MAATPTTSRSSTPASRPTRAAIDPTWASYFGRLEDRPPTSPENAEGPSLAAQRLAAGGQWRTGLGARRQLGRDRTVKARRPWPRRPRPKARPAPTPVDVLQATRNSIRAIMMIRAYRMRGHLHADLDPLKLKADEPAPELDPAELRLHRGRLRPQDLHRQLSRARIRHRPRDARDPQAHLLLDRRRRVHAHLRSRGQAVDPGAHGGAGQGDQVHARGQEGDPQQAGRGRGLREVPRRQVHRHQALRPRWLGSADPGARADHQARRRAGREGHRARHGASRPPQRPDPGAGQAAPRAVPRVQGRRLLPRRRRRFGRREVPPRRFGRPRVRRQQGAPVADRQPIASRDRRSGGAGQGPRQAGPALGGRRQASSSNRARPIARWCCRCCSMAMRPLPARA